MKAKSKVTEKDRPVKTKPRHSSVRQQVEDALRDAYGCDQMVRRIFPTAMTALAMRGDRIPSAGFDGFIAKPITAETFVSQVEAFLPSTMDSSATPPPEATL